MLPLLPSIVSIQMDELKNKSEDDEYFKELNDGNELDEFETRWIAILKN